MVAILSKHAQQYILVAGLNGQTCFNVFSERLRQSGEKLRSEAAPAEFGRQSYSLTVVYMEQQKC